MLYGSQTGNSERLAGRLAQRLQERGFPATLCCMSDYRTSNLRKGGGLLAVVSTHGEGDPPDNAQGFFEFLRSKRAPHWKGCDFAVLALGDQSYEQYCGCGKELDHRLEELGTARLRPRTDCNVDYQEAAEAWMEAVLTELEEPAVPAAGGEAAARADKLPVAPGQLPVAPGVPRDTAATLTVLNGRAASAVAEPAHDRTRPFSAEVLVNLNLNGRGSDKETRYLKLSLGGSGLSFAQGDSLGICPENHPELVEDVIRNMKWDADEAVPVGKAEYPLREALSRHYEITTLTLPLVRQAAQFSRDGLHELARGPDEEVHELRAGRDLLDLVRDFSLSGAPARDFVRVLRRLPPRLYSISSSQAANPDEVDVTVAAVRYESYQRHPLRHLLGPLRGAAGPRRLRAGLRALQPELPAAGRSRSADHHGGRRHGRGSVSGIFGGARGDGRQGEDMVVFRRSPLPH